MSEAKLEAKEARKALKAQKAEKRQAKREKSFLNKYFHHVDQGSTTGREIMAGLLICILRSLLLFHIGFGCPISRFLQFAFHRS